MEVTSPYFEWRAEQAASGSAVNVVNRSEELLGRFTYFRDRHIESLAAAEKRKAEKQDNVARIRDGRESKKRLHGGYMSPKEKACYLFDSRLSFVFGAGEMNRTPDLLITNELLYRLSYTG